nr:hypothetical protein [Tanacetum cinerariifolium]
MPSSTPPPQPTHHHHLHPRCCLHPMPPPSTPPHCLSSGFLLGLWTHPEFATMFGCYCTMMRVRLESGNSSRKGGVVLLFTAANRVCLFWVQQQQGSVWVCFATVQQKGGCSFGVSVFGSQQQ